MADITDKIAALPRKPDQDDKYGPEYLWYYQDLSARYKAERDLALEVLRDGIKFAVSSESDIEQDLAFRSKAAIWRANVMRILAACGKGEG